MNKFHQLPHLNISQKPSFINYPFNYTPHPWAILAAEEVKHYLMSSDDISHDFWNVDDSEDSVSGKMFGVLVCEGQDNEIGFLAAFSGKLGESNQYEYFVPPVFDILSPDYFFSNAVEEINEINWEIQRIDNDVDINHQKSKIRSQIAEYERDLENYKSRLAEAKRERDDIREKIAIHCLDKDSILNQLNEQSAKEHIEFKRYKRNVFNEIQKLEDIQKEMSHQLTELKRKRRELSQKYQAKIFQAFTFLNARGEKKDLHQLFEEDLSIQPPSGAGECAAPKLFQYAFLNQLQPLALAEFWWGQSPKSEIRKHGQYYPSCNSKCKPILSHMLQGLNVEENPMLTRLKQKSEEVRALEIVYEDDFVVAINKPEGFLSVPGNLYTDSVLERLRKMYPNATGPLLLHRLDMSTSGILLAAKEKHVHQLIQQQFEDRTIVKRYDAVLDGVLEQEKGEIDLPLRVDLNDRPRQIVDFEHGKHALTSFQRLKVDNGKTKVYFWPHTGRTHQLRVHASHELGLNVPILGDDLYGKKADRLYLHAGYLEFYHPILKRRITIEIPSPF